MRPCRSRSAPFDYGLRPSAQDAPLGLCNEDATLIFLRILSGLNLVALMYVAAQQRASGLDVGFDLAREYAMALGLRGGAATEPSNDA